METELGKSSASKASQPVVFAIDFGDPGPVALTDLEASRRRSIIVRIEPQNVLFILSATEPERATGDHFPIAPTALNILVGESPGPISPGFRLFAPSALS
jgi:hypothetical protein